MRKLLILVAALALLVIPAVPAAAQTAVTGTVPSPSITVTAPGNLAFGPFALGWNVPVPSGTTGTVSVANEVVGVTTWTVTTSASNGGLMSNGAVNLNQRLQITNQVPPAGWTWADVGLTYGGNPLTLPFYAQQQTVPTDFDYPGAYSIVITFAGNLTP